MPTTSITLGFRVKELMDYITQPSITRISYLTMLAVTELGEPSVPVVVTLEFTKTQEV